LAWGIGALAPTARAEPPLPLRARATAGAAVMTSPDQTGRLGYDTFGATGRLHIGYAFLPWMSAQLGFGAGAFPRMNGDTGGAIAPTLGVLATMPDGSIRPFVYLDTGPVFTGPLTQPYFHSGVGVDFRSARKITLGPLLGYGQIFQSNREGYSTDARSVELCATVTFQPSAEEPEERDTIIFREERVTERVRVIRTPAPPAPPAPPYEPSSELEQLLDGALPKARVELLAPVLFKFGSDELEPIGVAMLHEVARELAKRQDIRLIEIQGYADSRGSDEVNQELSARRAQHVLDWLVEHGVEPERLRVAARGESEPIEQTAETEEAHEQNRRVVFRVIEAIEAVEP
jgi:outer membrane protein OmpA-like peptidoglycan-associated protein